ncbi:MAG: RHS repeat-associated core domain-containing protein [Chitinophagaceae bacterium]|nr:RHS repeat-associated core domain-containing protein [Chitinophagaceae bacterium]
MNENCWSFFIEYNYYPFGMVMPERSFSSENYRYGYNGKEKDNEIKGEGNSLDFGARNYDSRLGRWLSVDPKAADAPGWSPYRAFLCNPIRYTDPDGQWEWDATGNLVAQKGDNSYSMAKFLGTSQSNAMKLLNRGGVTANAKGVLNLKEGQSFAKNNLWVGGKSIGSGPVVDNTKEATAHYLTGNGAAADVGDQSTSQLLGSDRFQAKLSKITSEKVAPNGFFAVDMTDLPNSFHIGNTGVDYNVSGNGTSSSVTFTLFTNTNKNSSNTTDGFWDPNFAAEKGARKLEQKTGFKINRFQPDEMGPNLEAGGTPYLYKTRERTFFFKPVK